jgi:hypothetical protein
MGRHSASAPAKIIIKGIFVPEMHFRCRNADPYSPYNILLGKSLKHPKTGAFILEKLFATLLPATI